MILLERISFNNDAGSPRLRWSVMPHCVLQSRGRSPMLLCSAYYFATVRLVCEVPLCFALKSACLGGLITLCSPGSFWFSGVNTVLCRKALVTVV